MDDRDNVEKRILPSTSYLSSGDKIIDSLSDEEFMEYMYVLCECSNDYLFDNSMED